MRSTILLSLGAGWGAVLGAEYLGAQSGLGYIIVYAQQFASWTACFLIALLFILYTSVSYWAISRVSARHAGLGSSVPEAVMNDAFLTLSARDLVGRMRSGAAGATDVMQAYLGRIDASEPAVRAWASSIASMRCGGHRSGHCAQGRAPVGHAPWAAGRRQGHHRHRRHADRIRDEGPPRPATDDRRHHRGRLRAAGAIVLGKTVTSEYALYVPGPTRNPRDTTRTPGGSSSGSAAAVAGRHGSGRTGDPNQRLDHPSGVILRRRGLQTQPRHFCRAPGS